MDKEPINLFEGESERPPSEEEIRDMFTRLSGRPDFRDVRKLSDKNGVYLWEVAVDTDEGGERYVFVKKGTRDESRTLVTKINFSRFDKAGLPVESGTAAKFIDGEWEIMD